MSDRALTVALDGDGFAIVDPLIDADTCAELVREIEGVQRASDHPHAIRDALRLSTVAALSADRRVRDVVTACIGAEHACVRAIVFDKTPDANWKVAWHQDRSVALAERVGHADFGPWSVKAGIVHADAPAGLLERMVTVRVHVDPCGLENGPLRVLPASHRAGKLSDAAIAQWRDTTQEITCVCAAGGAVLMRPLLLHASSAASQPGHRRVVHLEFGPREPASGLRWHEQG